MLNTTRSESSISLIAINNSNITQFAAISKGNIIDILFTNNSKVIKKVDNSINEVYDVGTINADSLRSKKIKLAKFKIFI